MESKIRQYFVAVSDDSLKLVRALITDKQEGTRMPLIAAPTHTPALCVSPGANPRHQNSYEVPFYIDNGC